jgi:hypothetical protein
MREWWGNRSNDIWLTLEKYEKFGRGEKLVLLADTMYLLSFEIYKNRSIAWTACDSLHTRFLI